MPSPSEVSPDHPPTHPPALPVFPPRHSSLFNTMHTLLLQSAVCPTGNRLRDSLDCCVLCTSSPRTVPGTSQVLDKYLQNNQMMTDISLCLSSPKAGLPPNPQEEFGNTPRQSEIGSWLPRGAIVEGQNQQTLSWDKTPLGSTTLSSKGSSKVMGEEEMVGMLTGQCAEEAGMFGGAWPSPGASPGSL